MNDFTDGNGWGVGLSAILGGALGYWAGRSNGPGFGPGFGPGAGYPYSAGVAAGIIADSGNCRTCYQEGVEAGQTLAGIDYIGQKVAANSNQMANAFTNLNASLTAQFNAINNQFNALNQQKIADQAMEIASLRTQNTVGMNAAVTNAALSAITQRLDALTAGCAVRAVPACPSEKCGCCPNG